MSKQWKVAIGVIVAVVIIGGLGLLRWGGVIYRNSGGERGWSLGAYAYQLFGWDSAMYISDFGRGPAAYRGEAGRGPQLGVRLVDDDEDGIPDRGVVDLPAGAGFGPGRGFERGEESGTEAPLLEVRLVDDDGDGVPDRGVIDPPTVRAFGPQAPFGPGFGPGRGEPFGPGFGPGRGEHIDRAFGPGRNNMPFGSAFGPLFIVGGLIRLAFLAVVIGLVIFFVRRWRSSPPATPANTQAGE